jgi:long-chain acyl-CoA synthetase
MLGTMAPLAYDAARTFSDRTAITMLRNGECASFAEIDQRAGRYAGGLARMGIGPGDRVGLHLPNGIDWAVAYHAIARLGAVVVPLNVLLSPVEVAFIVEDSGAKAVILPADRNQAIKAALAVTATAPLRIIHDGDPDAGASSALSVADAAWLKPITVQQDDLFTIGYTSGTTGRPKGAMQSHRAVFGSLAMTATIHVRRPEDTVLTALPFPHVYGNIVLNTAFLVGLQVKVMSRFDAAEALMAIEREGITLLEGVPTMYYQMLAHPQIGAADFSSLSRCTVGGQTMPIANLEEVARRFNCPVLELWGMTELAGPAISHSPYWPARHGTIGLPFPGTQARITDLENPSREAPDGVAGELCVRGPLVTMGYWNNPQATAASIDSNGCSPRATSQCARPTVTCGSSIISRI